MDIGRISEDRSASLTGILTRCILTDIFVFVNTEAKKDVIGTHLRKTGIKTMSMREKINPKLLVHDLEKPLVSVIVTTKNEERHIENCLKSVKKQTYPHDKIQLIVVDNNSLDSTVKIAGEFTDDVFNMGPERSAQRNFGATKAQGKYLLLLDADMILSDSVINECVNKCESEGYIALYIPERIMGRGFWIKIRDFERSFYNATCIDAVRFVIREKLLEIGGFDPSLTGPEDWDVDRRIRKAGKVGIINELLYHDDGEFSVKKYLEKKCYYFKGEDVYLKKWGKNDPIIRKQLGAYYRLLGVFIEHGKWKRMIKHPMRAVGMYLLRFMVALVYLRSKLRVRRSCYKH